MDPTLKPRAIRLRSASIYNADRARPLYGFGVGFTLDASASTDSGVNVDTSVTTDSDQPAPVVEAGPVDEPPFPGFPVMVDGPVGTDGTRCGVNGKHYLWDLAWPCNAKNQAAVLKAYYGQSALSRGYAQTQLRNIANLQSRGMAPSPYDGGDGQDAQSVWMYQMMTGTEKPPVGLPIPLGWGSKQIAMISQATQVAQHSASQAASSVAALQAAQRAAATRAVAAQAAAAAAAAAAYGKSVPVPAGAKHLVSAPLSTTKIAIGIGVLLAGGAAVYFVTRKKAA